VRRARASSFSGREVREENSRLGEGDQESPILEAGARRRSRTLSASAEYPSLIATPRRGPVSSTPRSECGDLQNDIDFILGQRPVSPINVPELFQRPEADLLGHRVLSSPPPNTVTTRGRRVRLPERLKDYQV